MTVRLKLGNVRPIAARVRCQCSEIIVKAQSDGTEKLRAKIVLIKDDGVFAVCKGCGKEVRVPLQRAAGPSLVIRK